MRLPHQMKGGVWKNTEDEILKAAVMKYGKNQWSRISSLLVRKSAKQCKARWYEWLDPSIKKTEWSREEEEKLLHLAKLMPTQWRTIAPIVGRTAAQCLEHYEKLLDAAQGKDEGYDARDDPRRLRPGEIDPNPEAKPARPDPVDMDEDEKEMLQEARARLANTRGKKAKRKAREKQLEEARRLAAMQKRRELKAAGIAMHKRKKVRGIDYKAEIPFQKNAPAGLFSTGKEEEEMEKIPFQRTSLAKLKEKRRDVEEQKNRQKDREKQRRRKDSDLPSMVMKINKLNDPESVRKYMKMDLPQPQISDNELEEIAKMNVNALQMEESDEGSAATRALMPSYGTTPRGPTPARTPIARTPAAENRIQMEAENLLAMTTAQTPLKGGENAPLHPSDFSGITPQRPNIQTPNVVATPSHTPAIGGGMTPRGVMTPRGGGPGAATPMRTPLRDSMGINEEGKFVGEGSGAVMLHGGPDPRLNAISQHVKSKLSELPAPKNEYSIVLPQEAKKELEDELAVQPGQRSKVEDATDLLEKQRLEEERERQAALNRRSAVLKRELPRPKAVNLHPDLPLVFGDHEDSTLSKAEEFVQAEVVNMLCHDAVKYPVPGVKQKLPDSVTKNFSQLLDSELEQARQEIDLEIERSKSDSSLSSLMTDPPPHTVHEKCQDSIFFSPSERRYVTRTNTTGPLFAESLQFQFDAVCDQIASFTSRAQKIEKKADLYTKGLAARNNRLLSEMATRFSEMQDAQVELSCFEKLFSQEQVAIPQRVEELEAEVYDLEQKEDRLQKYYYSLIVPSDSSTAMEED
eukprot:CAMPEP_0201489642 /NCGR_PEP_ID=MMETSP0151_2-20130828/23135_1 /ASSEMBLY_ACC=CAM_ASM_000257 /TAXON_ID=200890 /ORGANISM="Paramoeba atlantica, Strain 621/1 / CCAP 1560/9" /LENGTH=802 /DNA_ID=CAMNT_0047875299 /DNA_START=24 /DNA_END=2432 /DNA_ORIENTATION=+